MWMYGLWTSTKWGTQDDLQPRSELHVTTIRSLSGFSSEGVLDWPPGNQKMLGCVPWSKSSWVCLKMEYTMLGCSQIHLNLMKYGHCMQFQWRSSDLACKFLCRSLQRIKVLGDTVFKQIHFNLTWADFDIYQHLQANSWHWQRT